MTREELRHIYRDEICGQCYREFGCHWHGDTIDTCDGKDIFCQDEEDFIARETPIDLID